VSYVETSTTVRVGRPRTGTERRSVLKQLLRDRNKSQKFLQSHLGLKSSGTCRVLNAEQHLAIPVAQALCIRLGCIFEETFLVRQIIHYGHEKNVAVVRMIN